VKNQILLSTIAMRKKERKHSQKASALIQTKKKDPNLAGGRKGTSAISGKRKRPEVKISRRGKRSCTEKKGGIGASYEMKREAGGRQAEKGKMASRCLCEKTDPASEKEGKER